ncbi:MAG: glycosyltransferase family 2 protein [bacterium]
MAKYDLSLSVFFPSHNEVDNTGPLVEKTVSVLEPLVSDYEVIIVDDGSTDGTRELADQLAERFPTVRAVHHEKNRGYGGAVKTGIASATKEWIFFTDGDGQFDVGEIEHFLPSAGEYDAVVGYRLDRQDPFHRKAFAFCWGMLIRFLFGFRVRDLDCAFKLFRRRFFEGVELRAEGAVITVELFATMVRAGATIHQIGVHHYPRTAGEQSGGSLKVIFRAFKELFKLYSVLKHRP